MKKISWIDKGSYTKVLELVEANRDIINTISVVEIKW